MEMFDLMEMNCAMVEKDMITITDLEIKRVLDKKGVKRAISGPLKGPNVQVLKELPPVCLNVSGIRFGNETAIKMNVRKVDLNKTVVLEQDPSSLQLDNQRSRQEMQRVVTIFGETPNMYLYITQNMSPNVSLNLTIHQICH